MGWREWLKGPHRLTTEVRGDHGIKPPVRDIEGMVRLFLRILLPRPGRICHYRLEVECRQIPKARTGVHVICLAEHTPGCVELRVYTGKGDYQWLCHLFCPDEDVASNILIRARPAAGIYLQRKVLEDERQYAAASQGPRPVALRRRAARNSVMNEQDRKSRQLCKRERLREFCYRVRQHQDGGPLPAALIHREISSVMGQRFDPETLGWLVWFLVERGVLDPVSPRDETRFVPTGLFQEYAESYRSELAREERRALERQLETARRLLEAKQREHFRTQIRLQEMEEQIADQVARIQELEQALTEKDVTLQPA